MSVAGNYSKALYEYCAESGVSPKEFELIDKDFLDLAKLLESSEELEASLSSPALSEAVKVSVVNALVERHGLNKFVARILTLLVRNRRMSLFSDISQEWFRFRVESQDAVLGKVESPDSLSAEKLEELSVYFSKKLQRRIVFKSELNPTLIAGIRVTVAGKTYDGSFMGRLNRLREELVSNSGSKLISENRTTR